LVDLGTVGSTQLLVVLLVTYEDRVEGVDAGILGADAAVALGVGEGIGELGGKVDVAIGFVNIHLRLLY
jgi:hypothetical protein